jgi:hypothetical protein
MTRPVYYIDTSVCDYTFVTKDPWVLEFRCTSKDMDTIRKPKSLVSTKTGGFQMSSNKVSVVPGPPVDGKLLIRVAGERLLQ